MTCHRRPVLLFALALVAAAGCGPMPTEPVPSGPPAASAAAATAPPSDIPFAPVAWPASGTACSVDGAGTRLGRVEAVDARTVVFTLCAPDGAFLARLAHPAMGIVDAAELARVAANPANARSIAGHGAYRVVSWSASNVELGRVGAGSATATAPTVILRWAADPATRSADLIAGSVDGIDAPDASGISAAATTPSLAVVARPLLATAVLGFGRGAAFNDSRVRRALATGIDNAALVAAAFPPGSEPTDHLAPCEVPAGCAGGGFRGFNGPAATASLQGLGFNFDTPYTITVPDAPVAGLPDPVGVAGALSDQLAGNVGVTATVVAMPADAFRAAVDGGTISGLYIDAVASPVADPSAFYDPLLLTAPASLAARRAGAAAGYLVAAAGQPDPTAREAAYASAATALRDSVPLAPLGHAGAMAVFQADVKRAAASPLGADPLGEMTAGDRGQVVFEQASAPAGGWCGAQASADAFRLCALATDGLYGTAAGTLDPTPRLASACTPNPDATVWTCRLRTSRTADGLVLDAADVVATFRAMADPTDPVHAALGDAAFSVWDQLFGAASGQVVPASPPPPVSPSPSGSGAGQPSGSPGASGSGAPTASPAAPSSSPSASR